MAWQTPIRSIAVTNGDEWDQMSIYMPVANWLLWVRHKFATAQGLATNLSQWVLPVCCRLCIMVVWLGVLLFGGRVCGSVSSCYPDAAKSEPTYAILGSGSD
jgi:hypothetical protein